MSIIYKLQNISSSKLRGCNTLLDRAFLLCFKSSPETNTLISNEFNAILQPGEEVVKVALRVPLRSAAQYFLYLICFTILLTPIALVIGFLSLTISLLIFSLLWIPAIILALIGFFCEIKQPCTVFTNKRIIKVVFSKRISIWYDHIVNISVNKYSDGSGTLFYTINRLSGGSTIQVTNKIENIVDIHEVERILNLYSPSA